MTHFKQPPVLQNAQGELRKVGFELEFAHVGIEESAGIIQELYGGRREVEQRFSQRVVGTRLGDFNVEIDLQLLTNKTYRHFFEKLGLKLEDIHFGNTNLEAILETVLENLMTKFFPYEVASPPISITDIAQFEPLREALFEHHAEGTEAFPTNAFGTHINVEVPDTDAETIRRYLQAFLVLYPWLLEVGHTDFMRQKLTAFINPFPEEYVRHVLHPDYQPELDTLISDYHRYNPDRNRPLDLYPLFAALKPELIKRYANLGKVKPRRTFHYRLPNCRISQPDWSLALEWNNWVVIEELANNPALLAEMRNAYRKMKDDTLIGFEHKWAKQTAQWLS
ncbi:amidoligase family protein [Adhaeribacter soli]|uniref:Amidoligase n=1 Tax=Adhaeribacter soli TaxID=2607655 RepID=A0A5N1J8W8_9BACT|nr:amidoligase family protein [Adhaeribacter soli]KAA9345745.1 amidoligase [Adhaeribacter soli]